MNFISPNFWINGNVRTLSEKGKLMALYLLTCKNSNPFGCFKIIYKIISEDLSWNQEEISSALRELSEISFLCYDLYTGWVFLHNIPKTSIATLSHKVKYVLNLVEKIPKRSPFYSEVIKRLSKITDQTS